MSELAVSTIVGPSSLPELLAYLRPLGLRLLEIAAGLGPGQPDLRDPQVVEETRRALAAGGAVCHCVHSVFGEDWDLAAADPAARSRAVQNHAALLRGCAALGPRHLVVHPGRQVEPGEPVAEQLERSLESLRQLTPVAAATGVRLAVENLPPGYVGGSLGQVRLLLEGLPAEWVGYCCDTGHAQMAGGPASYVRVLQDRLIGVHWQDGSGQSDDHLFPGRGAVDWEAFFAALREVRYTLPLTLEAPAPEGWPVAPLAEAARRSAAQLRPLGLPRPAAAEAEEERGCASH